MKTKLARKQNGIHYTPERFAKFLAQQIWQQVRLNDQNTVRILDPACGDGRLLKAMVDQNPNDICIHVTGVETDADAASLARRALEPLVETTIQHDDFLDSVCDIEDPEFDIIITNPPYVRIQNLGRKKTEQLRDRFGLNGRIDLYQAFTIAATRRLKPAGTLGLLTSNRFMYVQAGQTMRDYLLDQYQLKQIFDFGDTRLFEASVLPVVLIGNRRSKTTAVEESDCPMVRIYQTDEVDLDSETDNTVSSCIFEAVSRTDEQSFCRSEELTLKIETGTLKSNQGGLWSLSNSIAKRFQQRLKRRQVCTFGEIAEIKVGIKTTADAVFVQEHWDKLATEKMPEAELLKPLITHHVCNRWKSAKPQRKVLYPYLQQPNREPIKLEDFPNANRYLLDHVDRLQSRKYLIDAGRKWYEIWVPQVTADWQKSKIVWPDISEFPNFSFDESGAIVNGDCYWIKLKNGVDQDWLYLMLAVANSQLAVEFYDTNFHNKLYSGRRRFMTQYVKQFPLPDIKRDVCQEIIAVVKAKLDIPKIEPTTLDEVVNLLIEKAFD